MRELLFILLFFPFIFFAQNRDYKSLDKAVKHNNEGNINKAIKFAYKVLDSNPHWNRPKLFLASVYANNNQIELAAKYLLKVYSENDPEDVKGIEQVVKLYYSNGYYNEALFYANKIISCDTSKDIATIVIDKYVKNCNFAIDAIRNPVDFNPVNLNDVNSGFADFVNTVSVDGKKLFFTRRIEYDYKKPQEDLFVFDFEDSTLTQLPFL